MTLLILMKTAIATRIERNSELLKLSEKLSTQEQI